MPVSVVVGGQFGSEGKGKVAHFLSRQRHATVAIRVGGSNSGHTVVDDAGRAHVFRHLPTASILPDTVCVLGPGCYVDPAVLMQEIERVSLPKERLLIDPSAFVITEEHKRREANLQLGALIGSTQSGTGAAVIDRIGRLSKDNLARNNSTLREFTELGSVRAFLRDRLRRNERLVIEGTQGYGLSVLQSEYYPKATSRDTTAAAFVAEAGVSPLDVDEIVLVLRAFPIRVAGDSGHLPREIDWRTVAREGRWTERLTERTSVTQRVRRVGRFDPDIVIKAIEANAPTEIFLNHADYFDAGCRRTRDITPRVLSRVTDIEAMIGRSIDWVGLSPTRLVRNHDYGNVRKCA